MTCRTIAGLGKSGPSCRGESCSPPCDGRCLGSSLLPRSRPSRLGGSSSLLIVDWSISGAWKTAARNALAGHERGPSHRRRPPSCFHRIHLTCLASGPENRRQRRPAWAILSTQTSLAQSSGSLSASTLLCFSSVSSDRTGHSVVRSEAAS